jgi:hypothetical protein
MFKRCLGVVLAALTVLAGLFVQVVAGAEPARPKKLDVSYITSDVYGVIVVHPQQMARSPEVAVLLRFGWAPLPIKAMGFDPLKIEQMVMLVPGPSSAARAQGPRFVLRVSRPADTDAVARAFVRSPLEKLRVVAVTVAGKKCYKYEWVAEEPPKTERPGGRPSVPATITCVADDRTVLSCPGGEAELKKMLVGGEVKTPLVERLRGLDVSDDVAAVFLLEPMRDEIRKDVERLKQRLTTSPEIHFDEIALLLRSATVKLDLTDAARSSAVLEAEDPAGAAKVEELLGTLRRVGKEDLARERKRLADRPEAFRKAEEPMLLVAGEVLDAVTWTKDGAQVTVALKGSKGLLGKWLVTSLKYRLTAIPAGPNSPEDLPATEAAPRKTPPPPAKRIPRPKD